MTRLRWLLQQLVHEHPMAPAVMLVGMSVLILARLFAVPL